jgi:hypothetical protein
MISVMRRNPSRRSDIERADAAFLRSNNIVPPEPEGSRVSGLEAALACVEELQMVRGIAEEQARRARIRLKIERTWWQVLCTIMALIIVALVCTGRWS